MMLMVGKKGLSLLLGVAQGGSSRVPRDYGASNTCGIPWPDIDGGSRSNGDMECPKRTLVNAMVVAVVGSSLL